METLRRAAVVLALAVAGAAVAYAAVSVYHLFAQYISATSVEAALASLSSVGVTVALLLLCVTTTHPPLRAMTGILLLAWMLVTLGLVALDSALRADLLATADALIAIGRVTAAILPALALLAGVLVALAMRDQDDSRGVGASAAHYVGFAAKLAAISGSVLASAYFGLARGVDPALAIALGVVLESCFLWSYLSMIRARERRDGFDLAVWSLATLCFGMFIAAVSVETVSTLARIDVPVLAHVAEAGASLYVSAVGLALALTVVTHLLARAIDIPMDAPAGMSIWQRVAGRIRDLRAGVADVRAALSEPAPAGVIPARAGDARDVPVMAQADEPDFPAASA